QQLKPRCVCRNRQLEASFEQIKHFFPSPGLLEIVRSHSAKFCSTSPVLIYPWLSISNLIFLQSLNFSNQNLEALRVETHYLARILTITNSQVANCLLS